MFLDGLLRGRHTYLPIVHLAKFSYLWARVPSGIRCKDIEIFSNYKII